MACRRRLQVRQALWCGGVVCCVLRSAVLLLARDAFNLQPDLTPARCVLLMFEKNPRRVGCIMLLPAQTACDAHPLSLMPTLSLFVCAAPALLSCVAPLPHLLAAKIAVIVICAVSALIVVVLSAVYTKRAIDKRLASVHVEETVQVQEQHTFLLGGRSSTASHDDEEAAAGSAHGNGVSTGGQAPAGEGGVRHGVMISVETPMLVVRSRSSSSEPGSKQQPLRTLGANPAGSQLGWGARVASRLGLGAAGSSGSTRKLKVTDDFDSDMMAPLHPQHQPGVMGDGAGSSTSTSSSVKPCCKNRNGH